MTNDDITLTLSKSELDKLVRSMRNSHSPASVALLVKLDALSAHSVSCVATQCETLPAFTSLDDVALHLMTDHESLSPQQVAAMAHEMWFKR